MPDILIRGLSEEAVASIDERASALGVSRNEYLKRQFEQEALLVPQVEIGPEDWARSAEAFKDLDNEEVMKQAWR